MVDGSLQNPLWLIEILGDGFRVLFFVSQLPPMAYCRYMSLSCTLQFTIQVGASMSQPPKASQTLGKYIYIYC